MNERQLFRGKAINGGVFVYGSHFWSEKENKHYIVGDSVDYGYQKVEVDPATVGQCTGQSAKKSYRGTEPEDLLIFEGDRVVDGNGHTSMIIWENGSFWFSGITNHEGHFAHFHDFDKCEIIGNIHDNNLEDFA